ncbi:ABC transporter permease [Paenibacillus elgii]|uniref:ABC transporter permease n=1 Tax=Paenibacillus elgii TaxID=189691 RepID=UPI00203D6F95|nr:ABC transporter permease [Paenibacillus elgii]MCM3267468.1 ABC transporter permease [Paenibacillus elgii]
MRILWTVAGYELLRLSRIKVVLLVLFLLPLLLILILGAALSKEFKAEDVKITPVKVAVVDQDQSRWSEPLKAYLDNPRTKEILQTQESPSRDEAVRALQDGRADYGLIVPEGFGEALLQGKPASWELIAGKDRGQNLIAETALESYLAYANSMQAAALTLGPQAVLNQLADASVYAGASESFVTTGRLGNEGNEYTALQYYAVSMLVMFMLYAGMTASISLVNEREDHTLFRLGSMPVTMNQVIFGKMLGNGLLTLFQACVIISVTHYAYGVDWGNRPAILLAVVLSVTLASMALAMLNSLCCRSIKSVTMAFQIVIMLMTFLSGGFIPQLGALERIGEFTVNHWAMQSILQLMLDGNPQLVLHHVTVLAAIAAALAAVAFAAYRKVGYRE